MLQILGPGGEIRLQINNVATFLYITVATLKYESFKEKKSS